MSIILSLSSRRDQCAVLQICTEPPAPWSLQSSLFGHAHLFVGLLPFFNKKKRNKRLARLLHVFHGRCNFASVAILPMCIDIKGAPWLLRGQRSPDPGQTRAGSEGRRAGGPEGKAGQKSGQRTAVFFLEANEGLRFKVARLQGLATASGNRFAAQVDSAQPQVGYGTELACTGALAT